MVVCPADRSRLERADDVVRCNSGHTFHVRDGIPLLLLPDERPTQEGYWAIGDEYYRDDPLEPSDPGSIDPYVRKILHATCGNLYIDPARFVTYPIPELRLPHGEGRSFLDVGSNWGRWTIAAVRKGYRAIGIDPSLGAVRAGYRVAHELGVAADFAVADGRHLPFPDGSLETVFSYSVLQHFAEDDAIASIREMARVAVRGATILVQMPSRYGVRNLQQWARRGFSAGRNFDVRYWSPRRLRTIFEELVGPTTIEVDGYFSLNPQASDIEHLSRLRGSVVRVSESLRKASELLPPLALLADSVYVRAVKA